MFNFRYWVVVISCGCLLSVPLIANAQAVPSVSYTPAGGVLSPVGTIREVAPSFGRTWAANSSVPGSVLVGDKVRVAIGSANADMYARRAIPWGGIAKGAARALPVIGTAAMAWALFDSVRCYAGSAGTLGGLLNCDPGQSTANVTMYRVGVPSGYAYSPTALGAYALSLQASATGYCNSMGSNCLASGIDISTASCTSTPTCTNGRYWARRATGPGTSVVDNYYPSVSPVPVIQTVCPAYTDRNGTAQPAGGSAGVDGKCPTGGMVATDPDAAAAKAEQYGAKGNAVQVAQEAVAAGVDLAPYAVPYAATGPASVTGQPVTTTTTPAGGGSPQTVTQTPVYNITYGDNVYNYSATNTTTNPDGSTVTKTGDTELKTCGLPGTPACKIDEAGTPNADGAYTKADAGLNASTTAVIDEVNKVRTPITLPWLWGFNMPTGACTNPTVAATSNLPALSIDLCGSPGIALWRSVWGFVLGVAAAFYGWRRFTETAGAS